MKIGIDASQLAFQGTGVARYVDAVLFTLLQDTHHDYTVFYSSLRQPFPSKSLTGKANVRLQQFPFPPTLLEFVWNKLHLLPIEMLVGDVDVFFTSDWTEPPATKAKKITTIHDLVVYKYPETSHPKIVATQKRKLDWVKIESDLIICDSQATKNDAMEILGIDEKRMRVIYPYVNVWSNDPVLNKRAKEKYSIEKPFILSVGKLEPRKNIVSLIKAFKESGIDDAELLIVGPQGWGKETDLKDTKNVRFLGFVPDADLFALYSMAEFFIYPSLYEGFGFPIVEAMMSNCPVAASNSSSLAEIVGDNGLLFDPHSIDDMKKALVTMHSDEKLRERYKKLGMERAKDFSMPQFSKQLLAAFKDVYDNRS